MNQRSDMDPRLIALEAELNRVRARLEELEDVRAVEDLLSQCMFETDTCHDEAFVDLFAQDGEIKLILRAEAAEALGSGDNTIVWSGRDGVRDFITHPKGHHSPELYGRSIHLNAHTVTQLRGDQAVANTYQFELVLDDGGLKVISAGNNQWTLHKESGTWLVRERRGAYLGDDTFNANLDPPALHG